MKLMDAARAWLHRYSIHAASTGAILSAAATGLSLASSAGMMGGIVPVWAVCLLFFVIFVLALVGALRKQARAAKPGT